MVDGHNIKNRQSTDNNSLSAIGIMFPTPSPTTYQFHGQAICLRTNQVKQLCGLITCMRHVFGACNSGIDPQDDPFHPFTPDDWSQQTSTMLRTCLIQNLPDHHRPEPVPSGSISSSRPT